MKTLKAARRAQIAINQRLLDKTLKNKFIRGIKCPYCNSPANLPEQLPKHMDRCRERERLMKEYVDPKIDPDFPMLGKPMRGTMRWKVLRG
jgi:hypothetical protein